MNRVPKKLLPRWVPFVAGGLLVVQFAALGVWQVGRGFEKIEQRESFHDSSPAVMFQQGTEVRPNQQIRVSGHYLSEQQFLLENIILDGHYGYYVLSPLDLGPGIPLLIVNRGWIEKKGPITDLTVLAARIMTGTGTVSLRGQVGALPRAGMRMGDAIPDGRSWPQLAVYPDSHDLEKALGRSIQPFVLLLDADEKDGFLRHWVPAGMGPGRHFAYAFQWFAMGAMLAGLLIWHGRKRGVMND